MLAFPILLLGVGFGSNQHQAPEKYHGFVQAVDWACMLMCVCCVLFFLGEYCRGVMALNIAAMEPYIQLCETTEYTSQHASVAGMEVLFLDI